MVPSVDTFAHTRKKAGYISTGGLSAFPGFAILDCVCRFEPNDAERIVTAIQK